MPPSVPIGLLGWSTRVRRLRLTLLLRRIPLLLLRLLGWVRPPSLRRRRRGRRALRRAVPSGRVRERPREGEGLRLRLGRELHEERVALGAHRVDVRVRLRVPGPRLLRPRDKDVPEDGPPPVFGVFRCLFESFEWERGGGEMVSISGAGNNNGKNNVSFRPPTCSLLTLHTRSALAVVVPPKTKKGKKGRRNSYSNPWGASIGGPFHSSSLMPASRANRRAVSAHPRFWTENKRRLQFPSIPVWSVE